MMGISKRHFEDFWPHRPDGGSTPSGCGRMAAAPSLVKVGGESVLKSTVWKKAEASAVDSGR